MKVHIIKPWSIDKDLGRAYNEAMALIPDNDFGCLCDLDTCFLTSDAGNILHEYAKRYPEAALFTCFTNRISTLSIMQLLTTVDNNSDIKSHINVAEKQKRFLYRTTTIRGTISGMLMMLSKKHWLEMPFDEGIGCLGVDTAYSKKLHKAGKTILRMDGLYIWHSYRLINGIYDKKHLQK